MEPYQSPGSVGIVETKFVSVNLPPEGLVLDNGQALPALTIAYETYGTLNSARDNVILICHALSGDAHVAGYHSPADTKPGWWDEMVGPGKGLDTQRFLVVCSNNLGGCKGTTGPGSINPATNQPYGSAFPSITIGDMVKVQRMLLQHLGIDRLAGVIGGSMGGMQVIEWSIRYPERVAKCICVASAASLSAQALSFDVVGRRAILNDPHWLNGDYYGHARSPHQGLAHARMIGHITYLSPEMMDEKFGREKRVDRAVPDQRFNTRFQVESYLHYQGNKFVERFDANSYLHITEAMDSYDLKEQYGGLDKAFVRVQARFLVIAVSSDWLFPPEQSLEIATALLRSGKRVSYCLLQAPYGHDAFLVDIQHLSELVRTFLSPQRTDIAAVHPPDCPNPNCPQDFQLIRDLVPAGSRVLDLGCGDGALLACLVRGGPTAHLGIDIDLNNVIAVLDKGLDVFQGDIDEGLGMIPDNAYDYVVLRQTLQVVRKPRMVLQEMTRVARAGLVVFPNFANWSNRFQLGLKGCMPKSDALPYEWHETPNIHLATLTDFVGLCRQDQLDIQDLICIPENRLSCLLVHIGLHNLGADRVLVKITRALRRSQVAQR